MAALALGPRLPALLAVISALLVLPSLGAGFLIDDYLHQNILSGKVAAEGPASPHGLFVFVDGGPTRVNAMIDEGTLPWWTLETLQIAFWRPLTELTHGLDHRLAPHDATLAHAQNLLWGVALVWLGTLLFREVHGVVLAAGFAAMVFAVDDGHAFPLVWVANRNTLIAGTLSIAALTVHIRGRRRGSRTHAVLGPALFVASLLAAEAALATIAYLAAHHWVYPNDGPASQRPGRLDRFRPLMPYLGIGLAYVLAYRLLGYGVQGSGQYLDPLGQPGPYLLQAAPRAVLLLAGQFVTLPLALEMFHYRGDVGRGVLLASAGMVVWVVARALVLPRWARPEMRFWVIGLLLCLPLALVLGPFSRVLMYVGVGGAGVLGMVFADWYESADRPASRSFALARRGLVAMHLVLAPLALVGMSVGLPRVMDPDRDALTRLPGAERETWIFVNPRAAFWTHGLVRESRRYAGLPVPTVRALASGAFGVSIRRGSEDCLDVTPVRGYLFLTADRLFRSQQAEMEVGWRRRLSGISIEVLEATRDHRPRTARFCFDRPLDDRSLRWIAWEDGEPRAFAPPAIGDALTLAPVF